MAGKTGKATSTTTDLAISASGSAGDVLSQGYYMQAGSTYAVIAGAQVTVAGTSAANAASLWILDSVDGVGQTRIVRAHNAADVTPVWWLRVVTPAESKWHHSTLRMQPGTANATVVSGALACLTLDSGDQSVTNDSVVTTTSTTYQDGQSVTFTVGSGETWLVLASADIQTSSSNKGQIRLYDGTTAYGQGDSLFHSLLSSYYPWMVAQTFTSAGSTTVKIQYASQDGAATTSVKNQRIVAMLLPASSFGTASDNTKTSTTSSSFQTRITATYTALAADHLVISSAWTEGSTANLSVGTRLTAGGSLMLDAGAMAPNAGTDDVECGLFAVDAGVSAGSRSWTLDWKSDGTNTGRIMSARLISMALSSMTEPTAALRRSASI